LEDCSGLAFLAKAQKEKNVSSQEKPLIFFAPLVLLCFVPLREITRFLCADANEIFKSKN
jgi:hypothetical protein